MLDKGTNVAGYEIEGVLGHGGMGVVYEARQLSLGRTVALKILAPTLGMDPSFKERFRSEGRIQAAIDHPNIVTVFEAGSWGDSLYIAMRLVRGPNLKEMIIARELEGARTLRILRPIADALDTAHEAGLIHRDIKPQNILVGSRDRAYLADFGLTKGIDDAGLTRTGQFVGTIDYIAPEQIRGEHATKACDIYALAAVLFECLTGTIPYAKPSDAAVMYAHLSEPPPMVTEQRPELPPGLDDVIARAMAKAPEDRYESATALIDEAERAMGKKVRAVITPPGPIEGPEEAGIRESEARVPTRPTRIRTTPPGQPTPETTPAPIPAPTGQASAPSAPVGTPTGQASAPAEAPSAPVSAPTGEASAPADAPSAPVGTSTGQASAPAAPVSTPTGQASAPADAPSTPFPVPTGGMETVAAPAVGPVEGTPPAPETVAASAVTPATETVATSAAAAAAETIAAPSVEPPAETIAAPSVEPATDTPDVSAAPETVAASAVPVAPDAPAPETIAASAVSPAPETVASPAVKSDEAGAPEAPSVTSDQPETPATVAMPAARRTGQRRRPDDWLASGGQSEPFSRPLTAPPAPAAPGPTQRAAPAGRSRFPIFAAVAALVVAAVVGYVLGKPGEEPAPTAAQPRLANSASTSALALGFPSSWARRGDAPKIPGLELKDAATVGPSGRNARGVTAGMADASGPRLLPAGFVKQLDEAPRPGDRVRLGKLEAFRYEGLEPQGFDGSLTLFAAPTSAGVATVACFAEAGQGAAFRGDCERVAGTLELTEGTSFPLAADPKYAQALNREIAALDARRRTGRTALARANRPASQATAARGLAATYSGARTKVADLDVSPAAAQANARLAAALGAASNAYRDLASAARGSKRGDYRRAAGAVRRAERNVQARLQALKELGYTVG